MGRQAFAASLASLGAGPRDRRRRPVEPGVRRQADALRHRGVETAAAGSGERSGAASEPEPALVSAVKGGLKRIATAALAPLAPLSWRMRPGCNLLVLTY